jgi:hypothetical protein
MCPSSTPRDVKEAEVHACLEGVHLVHRWPEVPMILESDCHSVVTTVVDLATH